VAQSRQQSVDADFAILTTRSPTWVGVQWDGHGVASNSPNGVNIGTRHCVHRFVGKSNNRSGGIRNGNIPQDREVRAHVSPC
jgi:hypothetical protein